MSGKPNILYLVDASIYVFRAWFSVPDDFVDSDGNPANAVYGFAGFLCSLLEQAQPSHIGIAFDESLESSYRNEIYPQYKANPLPAPIELKRQFAHCRAVAEALGLECFSDNRFEADDLIGTFAHLKRRQGMRVHIVSADKDLSQLVQEGEILWDFARNIRLDQTAIEEKFGVRADQMADYLALTGDAVDNIPGVPGVGPKSAAALLRHFGSLDEILKRVEEIGFLSLRGAKSLQNKIKSHSEDALLARELTRIPIDAPIPEPEPSLEWRAPDLAALDDLFDYLKFGRMLRARCHGLAKRFE
jgi:DNA polymerase-1